MTLGIGGKYDRVLALRDSCLQRPRVHFVQVSPMYACCPGVIWTVTCFEFLSSLMWMINYLITHSYSRVRGKHVNMYHRVTTELSLPIEGGISRTHSALPLASSCPFFCYLFQYCSCFMPHSCPQEPRIQELYPLTAHPPSSSPPSFWRIF